MRVVAHNRLADPIDREATRVAIYDGAGNLVALAFSYAANHVHVCHVRDPEWHDVVKLFGLDQDKAVVREINVDRLFGR